MSLGDGKASSITAPTIALPTAPTPAPVPPAALVAVVDETRQLYVSAKNLYQLLKGEPKHALLDGLTTELKLALQRYEDAGAPEDVHGVAVTRPAVAGADLNNPDGSAKSKVGDREEYAVAPAPAPAPAPISPAPSL